MYEKTRVVSVPHGVYDVGSDHIADARPRHRRLIDKAFWIDAEPVSVRTFAAFVQDDGYNRPDLWPGRRAAQAISVDERCDHVRDASCSDAGSRMCALGLTWSEACAIAAFSGARLPFEIEWEVGVGRDVKNVQTGVLEWTADVFSPIYWRADFAKRGEWRPQMQAGEKRTARGCHDSDLVWDVSVRRGLDPDTPHLLCGMRRVWDTPPTDATIL